MVQERDSIKLPDDSLVEIGVLATTYFSEHMDTFLDLRSLNQSVIDVVKESRRLVFGISSLNIPDDLDGQLTRFIREIRSNLRLVKSAAMSMSAAIRTTYNGKHPRHQIGTSGFPTY